MNRFATLFGIEQSALKKTCILTPFLTKEITQEFQIDKISQGLLYSVADNGLFSLIRTGMGSTLCGDTVLYLSETPCEHLLLFGSCGAVAGKSLEIGDLITIEKALAQDSFVNMLFSRKSNDVFYPESSFLEKIKLKRATCLTVGSVKLEEQYLTAVKNNSIDVVDMETAAFFAAATQINKKAAAILFITDTLKISPYYEQDSSSLKKLTAAAAKGVSELINNLRLC